MVGDRGEEQHVVPTLRFTRTPGALATAAKVTGAGALGELHVKRLHVKVLVVDTDGKP